MNNKELEDILADNEPIEEVKLNMEQVKANLPQYSDEKLCEMIVCDRYFGFQEKIAPVCMEELAKRRAAGNTFDFESYISQAYNELPVLDFTIPDIRSVLHQAMGRKFNQK